MKIRISHPALRELFDQLRFAPMGQKKKQLAAAEQLLMILNAEREYPYDFIVYRITGYRPRIETQQSLIPGKELLSDLRIWISQISEELQINVAEQTEPVFSVEQLAWRFNVSAKTIRRWQKRGLAGKMYVFEDGRKRLGFLESAVNTFVGSHAEQVRQSGRFSLLDELQKKQITAAAQELTAARTYRTQNELVLEIVRRVGRARQTVRSVLTEWQKKGGSAPALPSSRGRIGAREAAQLYKLNQQGGSIGELMQRFGRSRSSIYRIMNQQRAKELLGRRIEYIDSEEFLKEDIRQRILLTPLEEIAPGRDADTVLLSRRQEMELFRRYNCLKFLAHRECGQIERGRPRSDRLHRIEMLLAEADTVKKYIIEANMPLVVSIAGKHLAPGQGMSELVSEGSVALMAAVEKFDYNRGYRFSTYASWAIAKDFARLIPAEFQRPDRAGGADFTNLPANIRIEQLPDVAAVEQARRDLRKIIENNLDAREQYVILNHYALGTGVIPQKPKTLKQIGDELDLSKERVRQIELQALQKLRQSLSPEQFDLLTG
ncbi:MAG: sigma-70 family RNA polymerase sigma factor [Planctomycetales bacterium]|nr:sigma-70 family RNA polymerase sigma factor [Planctomycetales bacterium]